jgi:hypothetical protein
VKIAILWGLPSNTDWSASMLTLLSLIDHQNGGKLPDEIISLREESVAAQSMRFDLAKFKLIATAVLGSIAVGAGTTAGTERFPYVMGLIPLVSIYIDLIANTKQIQILVIGSFLKTQGKGVFAEYEKFCSELRSKRNVFADSYAFYVSTVFISITIALLGLGQLLFVDSVSNVEIAINLISGTMGLLISYFLNKKFKWRCEAFN